MMLPNSDRNVPAPRERNRNDFIWHLPENRHNSDIFSDIAQLIEWMKVPEKLLWLYQFASKSDFDSVTFGVAIAKILLNL